MMSPQESLSAIEQRPLLHQTRLATKCGHEIHPSASEHTPWCPTCVVSQSKERLVAAQKDLVAEGGLTLLDFMRGRMWNRARLRHDIAKLRVEQARRGDQLRWERERAWDEAHGVSQDPQTSDRLSHSSDCAVCDSLVLPYSTEVPKKDIAPNVAWWEQPGALVVEHTSVPRTPLEPRKQQVRESTCIIEASQCLRELVKSTRLSMKAADAAKRTREEHQKIERAIREKYGLDNDFRIDPAFWESPISGLMSFRNFQQIQEAERAAQRRARGSTPHPTPPRSSLSKSELAEELHVDEAWIRVTREKEEREQLEREAKKVAKEVGYLYFVGEIDDLFDWRDDVLQSDKQLVVRILVPDSDTSGSDTTDDEAEGYFDEYDEAEEDLDEHAETESYLNDHDEAEDHLDGHGEAEGYLDEHDEAEGYLGEHDDEGGFDEMEIDYHSGT